MTDFVDMEGQLSEHPLAELIREISAREMSGALRLSRERAKAVIYFESGLLVFAASNLRAHRLREYLKSAGPNDAVVGTPRTASDDELAKALMRSGKTSAVILTAMRTKQVSDVLRVALLW